LNFLNIMENLIISDWNGIDSNSFYKRQLNQHPLVFSAANNLWVAHSYAACKSLFVNENAIIPELALPREGKLNKNALLIIQNLVRLSNGKLHERSRPAAVFLYNLIKKVNINNLMDTLIDDINDLTEFDCVAEVCKKLPVQFILKGLGFSEPDCAWVTENIDNLVKIMSPNKTLQDITEINCVTDQFYSLSENYICSGLLTDYLLKSIDITDKQEVTDLLISNLAGLFIQSYDACRGLLSNSFVALSKLKEQQSYIEPDMVYLKKMIIELLRINPPVHNTRRVAARDINCEQQVIKAVGHVLIVMAAANLDPETFKEPEKFDPLRANNTEHLTFGFGGHACIAKYLTIDMAAETCKYLIQKFKHIVVITNNPEYESKLNVKLIKKLIVNLY
jgi:cytochrome P450